MKIAHTETDLSNFLADTAASLKSQAMCSPVLTQAMRDELSEIADRLHGLAGDAFTELAQFSS